MIKLENLKIDYYIKMKVIYNLLIRHNKDNKLI